MVSIRDYSTTAASNVSLFPEGMSPGTVNDSAREVQAELAKLQADFGGTLTTGGTTTAYTVTLNTTPAALTDGLAFSITANATNAVGPVTLVVTPLGGSAFASKKIKSFASGAEADLAVGEMIANGHYDLQYDSAADSATGAYILTRPNPVRAQSLANNGYVKLPGGVILQWGRAVFAAASAASVSYPTAFTVAPFTLQFTHNFGGSIEAYITDISSATFFDVTLNSASSGTVFWFAVGR